MVGGEMACYQKQSGGFYSIPRFKVLGLLDPSSPQLCHEGKRIYRISQKVDASLDAFALRNQAGNSSARSQAV